MTDDLFESDGERAMDDLIKIHSRDLSDLIRAFCGEETNFIEIVKEMLEDADKFKRNFDSIKALDERELLNRIIKVFRLGQTSRYHRKKIRAKELARVIEEIMGTAPEKLMENIDDKLAEWDRDLSGVGIATLTRILALIYPDYFAPWIIDIAGEYLAFLGFERPRTYSGFLNELRTLEGLIHDDILTYCGRIQKRYINLVVDHFGWWLGKNKKLIKDVVERRIARAARAMKAQRGREWLEKKAEVMNVIEKLREAVKKCAREPKVGCYKIISKYEQELRRLYSAKGFIIWPYGSAGSDKEAFLSIVRSKRLRKVIARIEELKREGAEPIRDRELWDLISDLFKAREKNLGFRTITSFLFIFDPMTFYPVVNGALNDDLIRYLGIKLKGGKRIELDYRTFLEALHKVTDKEGIESMAELSFYLSGFSLDKIGELVQGLEGYNSQNGWNDGMTECSSGSIGPIAEVIDDILERKGQIILYGPPGTGKTWLAKKYAECRARATHEFITFHQSYSYEEFIEGIWPGTEGSTEAEVKSAKDYGQMRFVFMEVTWAPAPERGRITHVGKVLWGPLDDTIGYLTDIRKGDVVLHYITTRSDSSEKYRGAFIGYSVAKTNPIKKEKKEMRRYLMKKGFLLDRKYANFANNFLGRNSPYEIFYIVELENFILFKKPVKYSAIVQPMIRHRLGILGSRYYVRIIPSEILRYILEKANMSQYIHVENNHIYEKESKDRMIKYSIRDGVFKRMAILAICELLRNIEMGEQMINIGNRYESKDYTACKRLAVKFLRKVMEFDELQRSKLRKRIREASAKSSKYVLVIDEINRGDISRILGDLISLLEIDKRLGSENEIIATLPYSREPFAVPPNLYIIGTMNTADRSIALVDIALRRRFAFIEIPPDPGVIVREAGEDNEFARKLASLLKELNKQIERKLGREHRIGHSYFLGIKDPEDLGRVWVHEIMPLLSEYFYNRWGDLREVLSEVLGRAADRYFIKLAEEYQLRDWREWYEVGSRVEELYRKVGEELIRNLRTSAENHEVGH